MCGLQKDAAQGIPAMTQTIVVAIVLIGAVGLLIRHVWRLGSGSGGGCACGRRRCASSACPEATSRRNPQ